MIRRAFGRFRAACRGFAPALFLTVVAQLCACSPAEIANSFSPVGHYSRYVAQPYGVRRGNPRQVLDVYVPNEGAARAHHPVVIFFYGASWQGGSKDLYQFVGEALTSEGFVVVIPDYRVYPQVRFPAFIEDGAAVVRWTQDNIVGYGGDPTQLVLMGHSAGAQIAAMLGLDEHYLAEAGVASKNVRAVVGIAGPYDFLPLTDPKLQALFTNAEGLDATQPINFVRRDEPPLLLMHGLDDTTVLPLNSQRLAAAARAVGAQAKLIEYPEYGNVGIIVKLAAPLRGGSTVLSDIVAFLRAHTGALTAPAAAQ
jgi:acetyl esterase/lipase